LIAGLPRLFRLFYPYAWFEDSAYLYHAFAFKSGLKPFIDTICVHPPTIEYLLAGLYNLFGISYRVAEVLSAVIISLSTIFLFDIARRIFDKHIGLFVAATFSFSSLLFRYHIFEREVFTIAITIFILWFITNKKLNTFYALIIGILAGFAFGIKFSGLFIIPAIIGYLLFEREYRVIFFAMIGFIITSAVIYSYFLLTYKESAYYQLFLFHFFKGYDVSIGVRFLDTFVRDLNYLWILGCSGILLSLFIPNRILIFPIIIFVEYTMFFIFISSTCWPHNMIDVLLPLSLGNGVGLFYLNKFFIVPRKNLIPVILIVLSIFIFIFIGALRPVYYQGLGYISRNEVTKVAKFIRENTPERIPIHAPHYLANEAQRPKIIDYEELIGPYRLMVSTIKNRTKNSEKTLHSNGWYELIEKTLPLWRNELNNAITEKKISCAVWDKVFPEWSLMYNIDRYLENKFNLFSNAGFKIMYNNNYYTVWLVK